MAIAKLFVLHANTITLKPILNVAHRQRKVFTLDLPKTTLNDIFNTFLSYWKTSDLHLMLEDFNVKELY